MLSFKKYVSIFYIPSPLLASDKMKTAFVLSNIEFVFLTSVSLYIQCKREIEVYMFTIGHITNPKHIEHGSCMS